MAPLTRRDARGAPNTPPGPLWTILADVTTIYGKRRVTVRIRGGRRFTVAMRAGELDDATLTELLASIVATRPQYPMAYIDGGSDG